MGAVLIGGFFGLRAAIPSNRKTFSRRLKERGFAPIREYVKKMEGGRVCERWWRGVRLRPPAGMDLCSKTDPLEARPETALFEELPDPVSGVMPP